MIKCPNCGTENTDDYKYCKECGQNNTKVHVSFGHFLYDYLGSSYNFDTKVLATLRDLLIYPGRMTIHFNQNKRARYVSPIKFYIFVSFIFFLLYSVEKKRERREELFNAPSGVVFDISADSTSKQAIESEFAEQANDGWMEKQVKQQIKKFDRKEFASMLSEKIDENIPRLMFLLMPLFALLLKLIFRKKKWFYVEHLVLSIHWHTFFFMVSLLLVAISLIFRVDVPGPISLIIFTAFTLLSFRRVYNEKWIKTIFKTLQLFMLYTFIGGIVFVGGVFISVLML